MLRNNSITRNRRNLQLRHSCFSPIRGIVPCQSTDNVNKKIIYLKWESNSQAIVYNQTPRLNMKHCYILNYIHGA